MQKWYGFLYHNISWGEDNSIRGIGGTCSPDIFREHIELLSKFGKIVTVSNAIKSLDSNSDNKPLISIFFDDGFKGSCEYGLKILEEYGYRGSIAICPNFYNKKDILYRMKLSSLHFADADRIIRTKIRVNNKIIKSIKEHTLSLFSTEMLLSINENYNEVIDIKDKNTAKEQFCSVSNLNELQLQGHELFNHTLNHYPITENINKGIIEKEYVNAGVIMNKDFNIEDKFWVVPFGIYNKTFMDIVNNNYKDKVLILCGNKVNTLANINQNIIYRFVPPLISGKKYIKYLKSVFK
jgi:peptidoglycan/xylan/chitin deacetylase (PgdA/CDA1 family)